MDYFSNRFDYKKEDFKDIVIREGAPQELRTFLLLIMLQHKTLKVCRKIICTATLEAPDPNNWSENDFMKEEVEQLLLRTEWYHIYDAIEMFAQSLDLLHYKDFETKVNSFFIKKGIGWQLKDKILEIRGNESFENILQNVEETLNEVNAPTSRNEIKEAIRDLSRRPNPEITGAIQHSVAALECLCREITNDRKLTLGQLIKSHPEIVPSPLNIVIDKIFGFSSEKGRHLKEGNAPSYEEAELIVHLSAALCSFLCKKNLSSTPIPYLPFS